MPQFGRGKPAAGAFFDSDFRTIDSILAVGLLHGLQAKGDCTVAIVTLSRPNLAVAGYLDVIERYYRGPAGNFSQVPPIGMCTEGPPGETSAGFVEPLKKKKADGTPVYQNEVQGVNQTGDPTLLIRNYLQAQYDQNCFFVLSGPSTNLAAALDFEGVKELLVAKAKYLVVAGGAFPSGPAEAHIKADIPAFKKLLAQWPTPIFFAGNEVGATLEFPGLSLDKDAAEAAADQPIAAAYRANQKMPYNAPSWAMAAALYASRPKEGYFKLSAPGQVSVDGEGRTLFTAAEKGTHQYLIVDAAQKEKIVLAYSDLAATKAVPRRFGRGAAAADQQDQQAQPKTVPPVKK
jgi:purine nucleosidase